MKKNPASRKKKLERDQVVCAEFERRKASNHRYSLRRFAADTGLSPSFVAYLMRGLRSLSHDQFIEVAKRLNLAHGTSPVPSAPGKVKPEKKTRKLGEYRSAQFSEMPIAGAVEELTWLDAQISDLTLLRDFQPDIQWMSKKLGISAGQAAESVEKLLRIGILISKKGTLVKSKTKIYLSSKTSTSTLRKYHKEAMQRALKELELTDDESFRNRLITGATVSISPELVPLVREKMNNFIQEVIDLASPSNATKLYQFNLQFFSLTKS